MADAPIALMLLVSLAAFQQQAAVGVPWAERAFAAVYREFVLRWRVFFAAEFVFMNLFRGEILDRSLHYYFLCSTAARSRVSRASSAASS